VSIKPQKIVTKNNRLLHTIRPLDGFGTALSSLLRWVPYSGNIPSMGLLQMEL
jgi:hypothetical protein